MNIENTEIQLFESLRERSRELARKYREIGIANRPIEELNIGLLIDSLQPRTKEYVQAHLSEIDKMAYSDDLGSVHKIEQALVAWENLQGLIPEEAVIDGLEIDSETHNWICEIVSAAIALKISRIEVTVSEKIMTYLRRKAPHILEKCEVQK